MSRQRSTPRRVSDTVRVVSVFAAVLVVMVHYGSRDAIPPAEHHGLNYLLQEFICNGLCRISTPLFAIIAGYFFNVDWAGASSYFGGIRDRIRTLFVPYVLASVMMLALHRTPIDGIGMLLYETLVSPQLLHLWFLRDLMILVVLSPLLLLRAGWPTYVVGGFFGGLWLAHRQIFPMVGDLYFLDVTTCFFFWFGGLLAARPQWIEWLLDRPASTMWTAFALWGALLVLRVDLMPDFDIFYADRYTTGTLVLQKLSMVVGIAAATMLASRCINDTTRYLSGLTFFVYLFHIQPVGHLVRPLAAKLVAAPYTFYLRWPLAVLVSLLAAHLLARHLPSVFNWVTGRKPPAWPGPAARRHAAPPSAPTLAEHRPPGPLEARSLRD